MARTSACESNQTDPESVALLNKRFRYGIGQRFAFLREDEVAVALSKQAERDELSRFILEWR